MTADWNDRVASAALRAGVSPGRLERSSPSSCPHFDDSVSDSDSKPYVLFWCSLTFRLENNEALAVASELAKELHLPLVVLACVDMALFHRASLRQVSFILEGISGFSRALWTKKIPTFLRMDPNVSGAEYKNLSILGPGVSREKDRLTAEKFSEGAFGCSYNLRSGFGTRARVIVADKRWAQKDIESIRATSRLLRCPLFTVNTQTLFSVQAEDSAYVSQDSQHAHLTELANFPGRIRSEICGKVKLAKIEPNQECQLQVLRDDCMYHIKRKGFLWTGTEDWKVCDWSSASHKLALSQILESNGVYVHVNPLSERVGGELAANATLSDFIARRLPFYVDYQQELSTTARQGYGSLLSPYMSLGFISSRTVVSALLAVDATCSQEEREAITMFFRSLCRREIAYRKAHFKPPLNEYEDLPLWLRNWLEKRFGESAERKTESVNWSVKEWAKGATPNLRWNSSTSDRRAATGINHSTLPCTLILTALLQLSSLCLSYPVTRDSEVMKAMRLRGQW